jgi:hypothetical protein
MAGTVTAELGYLDAPFKQDDGRELHYYADFSGSTNARLKPRPVAIQDARGHVDDLTLDRNGFALQRWPTQVPSFIDTQAISDQYVGECEALIRDLTGCDATCQAGPIHCRFDGVTDPKGRYDGRPAHYVHADFSPASVALSKEWLPADLAGYRRYAIYNIWRVVTPPPQSQPLAVCDAATLRPEDAQESRVILSYPDREAVEFFTLLFHPHPRHRWWYFSDMTAEEVLIFKSFDSDAARAGYVPHCAFRDPAGPAGAARVSVEARIWAAFGR